MGFPCHKICKIHCKVNTFLSQFFAIKKIIVANNTAYNLCVLYFCDEKEIA